MCRNAPCQQSNMGIFSSKINNHGDQDAPSADSPLAEEEFETAARYQSRQGFRAYSGQGAPCGSALSLCLQVCSSLSHETRLVTTHRRMDHVVPLFPPYTALD